MGTGASLMRLTCQRVAFPTSGTGTEAFRAWARPLPSCQLCLYVIKGGLFCPLSGLLGSQSNQLCPPSNQLRPPSNLLCPPSNLLCPSSNQLRLQSYQLCPQSYQLRPQSYRSWTLGDRETQTARRLDAQLTAALRARRSLRSGLRPWTAFCPARWCRQMRHRQLSPARWS